MINIELLKTDLRKSYIGLIPSEFEEDFQLFKTVKRTLNSYFRKPDASKIHAIYNKIYILTSLFEREFLFEKLVGYVKNADVCEKETRPDILLMFIITKFFDLNYRTLYNDNDIDESWLNDITEISNVINN